MLVLASASPRRKQLLQQIGYDFAVRSADIDESVLPDEDADDYLLRIAKAKACAVAPYFSTDDVIIAADTSVVLGEQILGKPTDAAHAEAMLMALSGQWHQVKTGVAISYGAQPQLWVQTTEVLFGELSQNAICDYIDSGEPFDKAGAYGIQGYAGCFVEQIRGCFYNVVGLPLAAVKTRLNACLAP